MATLQSFYPWVSIDCPGTPTLLMDDAIREGAREFCSRTHCIEYKATLTTVIGQQDYALTLPTDTEVLTVLEVRRSATDKLTPTTEAALDGMSVQDGTPSLYAIIENAPLELRLAGTPTAVEALTVRYVLTPTESATTVDDRLLAWYRRGVTSYAKYALMSQPGKGWTNVEQAAFEYRRFEARVSDARVRRAQFRADLEQQVQMRPLA